MVVCYLANARLPTEKAHGLQIVENCDALARAGARVTLVGPRRVQPPGQNATDVWAHYGIERTFEIRRVPCIDLLWAGSWCSPLAARLLAVTYTIAAMVVAWRVRADVYFSRDPLPLLAVAVLKPRATLAYEVHTVAPGRAGAWLQRACVRRASLVIAVTSCLASDLTRSTARHVLVLRDGFRPSRIAHLPGCAEARATVGIPAAAFCAGYLGQLETMGAGKGLDDVIDALQRLNDPSVHLCLVGGPRHRVDALRARWLRAGLRPDAFHWHGDVPPAAAIRVLPAFDVCLLPLPLTTHFARYASPLKLFEYMAAGRAIVATDLPAIAEVVTSDESALLVPPGDVELLAAAIAAARDHPELRTRLGARARQAALAFTWDLRAQRILEALASIGSRPPASSPRPDATATTPSRSRPQ
jgi:glycosyltransferase involved in cell wall biosynthesis